MPEVSKACGKLYLKKNDLLRMRCIDEINLKYMNILFYNPPLVLLSKMLVIDDNN